MKFVINNVFVTLIRVSSKKVLLTQSLGKRLFLNKNKRMSEAFNVLLTYVVNFIKNNSLNIHKIFLNNFLYHRYKNFKEHFQIIDYNQIQIVNKINHNGCRTKKLTRKRNYKFKLNKFKL